MSTNISSKFPFDSHYIEINGSKMHYVDIGEVLSPFKSAKEIGKRIFVNILNEPKALLSSSFMSMLPTILGIVPSTMRTSPVSVPIRMSRILSPVTSSAAANELIDYWVSSLVQFSFEELENPI